MTLMKADEVMARINQAAQRGVEEAARVVESMAVQRAPIRDGDLRNSAMIKPGQVKQNYWSKVVAFNIVYAARQHEETSWNHPRGGQAKYLSSVLDEEQDRLLNIVNNHLKGVL